MSIAVQLHNICTQTPSHTIFSLFVGWHFDCISWESLYSSMHTLHVYCYGHSQRLYYSQIISKQTKIKTNKQNNKVYASYSIQLFSISKSNGYPIGGNCFLGKTLTLNITHDCYCQLHALAK